MTVKVHHITVCAYARPEDALKARAQLTGVLPKDTKVEETILEPEGEGEVFTKELVELKAKLTRQPEIREFTKRLFAGLDGYDRERLAGSLEDRVDDECVFYLRLSKTEAAEGNFVLESKDCIHVACKMAAYPARKEAAVAAARGLLDGQAD